MDGITVGYSGEEIPKLWIEDQTLYIGELTEINLSGLTFGEVVDSLNSEDGITAKLVSNSDEKAEELNEVSRDFPAEIKQSPYALGYGNYSSPKKVSEMSHKNAERIRNSWLDEADAFIESLTGLSFREKSEANILLDIGPNDLFSTFESRGRPSSNGLCLRRYAPIMEITFLEVDGVYVTPSTVGTEYDRIFLSPQSEAKSWRIGRSKAKASISYGYKKGSRESILASEFSTLYAAKALLASEFRARERLGPKKISHASVVLEGDGASEEGILRKEMETRMVEIQLLLPKKMGREIG